MSYTVLARKWRPRNFAEMAGQEHVLRALINALDNDRLHHGFLFTGTRGVGKTTIARILAKCLNCEAGVTSAPCGECSACVAIDDGRFVDLIEVDAASRTKVDDTRELLDNVQYAPTSGRYKVYLIDEVHMLSRHSFNALLKTLEEPPPHVKFLLATTDPQRLPVTVLSRCLQFNLKRLPRDLITERLKEICIAEKFDYQPPALELLARGADGSMRDALSLLDQAVAYGAGNVHEADVRTMLGTVERNKVFELAGAVADRDAARVLNLIAAMSEFAPDYADILQDLALLLQRAAIYAMTSVLPRDSAEMQEIVKSICEKLGKEEIQLTYQIAIVGRRDLPLAPDARSGFEMVLLRMLAFLPADASSAKTSSSSPSGKKPQPVKKKASAAVGQGPSRRLSSSAALPNSTALDFGDWKSVIDLMGIQGAARQLAANCTVTTINDRVLKLCLAEENSHMLTPQVLGKLEALVQNHLGDGISVMVETGRPVGETPASQQKSKEMAAAQSVRDSVMTDPNVLKLIETFDAKIHEDSIKPIN